MVNSEQLNEQVELLAEMIDGIETLKDDIQYLTETKDDAGLSEQKAILEAAKQKAKLVIGAISRRVELLDADHKKLFDIISK